MGLYGSPDLTPKNNHGWEKPKKKRDWSGIIWAIIIVVCLVFIIGTKEGNLYFKDLFQKNSNSPLQSNTTTNSGIGSSIPVGSRKNPARIGDIQQGTVTDSRGLDCTIELELLEVKTGEEAEEMAKNIQPYTKLSADQQCIFAQFRAKNIKDNSGKDIPFNFNWSNFDYATDDYKKYDYTMPLATGEDLLGAVDLYEGAEQTAWIVFYVEKNDTAPKAVFLDEIWFELAE